MSKKIKTTDTDLKVDESTILVVEIGTLSFEVDERYPWIDVYSIGNNSKKFVTQIDEENMPVFVGHEELKRFALNWYFNNVEIVKEIDKKEAAPEVEAQEQPQNLTLEQLINTESNLPLSYWLVATKNEIDQLKLKVEKLSSSSSSSHF